MRASPRVPQHKRDISHETSSQITTLPSSHIASSFFYCESQMALLLLFVLLSQIFSPSLSFRSTVEFLPGFHGPLPFHLETGYVGVGESEEVQVFYYFIKSKSNPKEDPILLWLSGGPGCSSFTGLIYEIGPLAFIERYNESLPSLVLRPQTWAEVSSIIFVDLPAGTGFTYAKAEADVQQGDWNIIHHCHQFLRKWLIEHPEYLSNKVYVGGDSYSGIPIPAITLEISNGNENGIQPWINLEGYILGNPVTTGHELNYAIPFAHGMALISDELYVSLKKNCKGEYTDIDPENLLCLRDFHSFQELTENIYHDHILYPYCGHDTRPPKESIRRRYLSDLKYQTNKLLSPDICQGNKFLLSDYWANSDVVRQALYVRKGTVRNWTLCNGNIPFKHEIDSSFYYHVNLSAKGYRSLIYSGDHDMVCPFLSTQAWIKSLNYSIVDEWRPWHVSGQVAGYTRTYSNRMTFATVKGAGHTAPEFKPEECLAMFNRWMSNEPL